jgi:hypothetical protein
LKVYSVTAWSYLGVKDVEQEPVWLPLETETSTTTVYPFVAPPISKGMLAVPLLPAVAECVVSVDL